MKLEELIKQFRTQEGLTMQEFADRCGLSKGYVSMLEKGQHPQRQRPLAPSLETYKKIAAGMNLSLDALLYSVDGDEVVSLDFSSPPPGFQAMPPMDFVPLVGDIACGTPILAEENITEYISAPSSWRADFCLECHGDSMAPKILDGDIVAIRKVPVINSGQIAAVRIDDEATLKRLYRYPDKLVLQAENPAYEPIVLIGEDMERVAIEGLAVGLMRHV